MRIPPRTSALAASFLLAASAAMAAVPAAAWSSPRLAGGVPGAALHPLPGRPAWPLVRVLHAGPAAGLTGYTVVIAPGRRDAWAFGGTNPGGTSAPLAEHWNGRRWQRAALPQGLHGFITAAAALSPQDIWAVSDDGSYLLHYGGRRWQVARRFHGGSYPASVAVTRRSGVWVFGAGPQAWNFERRAWRQRPAPGVVQASAAGRSAVWAVAQDRHGLAVIRRSDDRWRYARSRALAGVSVNAVSVVSADSVWVTGTAPARTGAVQTGAVRVVAVHWDGHGWRRFTSPWAGRPGRSAPDGRGGLWIPVQASPLTGSRWIVQLSAAGRWRHVTLAGPAGGSLSDLALIPGSHALWGSGGVPRGAGGAGAIWSSGPPHRELARPVRRAARAGHDRWPAVAAGRLLTR